MMTMQAGSTVRVADTCNDDDGKTSAWVGYQGTIAHKVGKRSPMPGDWVVFFKDVPPEVDALSHEAWFATAELQEV